MSKPIRVKRPTTKRVVDTSAKTPKISPQQVARALGAGPEGQELPRGLPPSAHLDLVALLVREIQSSGGRPARREETERKKIPLTSAEWDQLQAIADECKNQGISASPGQIGGLLVREGLKHYDASKRANLQAAASSRGELSELQPVADSILKKMKEHT